MQADKSDIDEQYSMVYTGRFQLIPFLGDILRQYFGPFRLLTSHLFLVIAGLYFAFTSVMFILPKLFTRLPLDRGREFASQAQLAKGKPTASGIIFIPIFIIIALMVVPFNVEIYLILGIALLTCISGYLDDSSKDAWGEYVKGFIDLILALSASIVIAEMNGTTVWIPFSYKLFLLPLPAFIVLGTVIIWISINCTNCSDGVDGLSSTLAIIGLVSLGLILYLVLGNVKISEYLLLPFIKNGAAWAIVAFSLAGAVLGYLWYNAFPSSVLMGDAGSRTIGFIIGILVLVTGNPFLLFVVSTILLVNGGTGLVKVALLRFFKIKIFHNIRFPLHDHVRETRNWSNPQVLVKFTIIQILLIISILGIFIKVR